MCKSKYLVLPPSLPFTTTTTATTTATNSTLYISKIIKTLHCCDCVIILEFSTYYTDYRKYHNKNKLLRKHIYYTAFLLLLMLLLLSLMLNLLIRCSSFLVRLLWKPSFSSFFFFKLYWYTILSHDNK